MSWSSTERIDIAARSGFPAPLMTDHDCAIESMRASSFWREPSGVPLSKKARRYHLPSQASRSTTAANSSERLRHQEANSRSPRLAHTPANFFKTSTRNQASQTLSPFPLSPTLLMPSFQSHEPIRGKP